MSSPEREMKKAGIHLDTCFLVGEAGLDLHFRRERKLRCCRRPAADKQPATGRPHLIGSSPIYKKEAGIHLDTCFLVGEAGLEPARPQ